MADGTEDDRRRSRPPRPAPEVVPRWEWRSFARRFPARFSLADSPELQAISPQDELYLLSSCSQDNVKVRQGRIEVKELVARDPDGLELWRPTLKAVFPLAREALVAIARAWKIDLPMGLPAACDEPTLLDRVVAVDPALCRVPIRKRRLRFTDRPCPGEWVEILAAGERWESIAFEDAEPRRLVQYLRSADLDPRTNLSYPEGLKRLVGLTGNSSTFTQELI